MSRTAGLPSRTTFLNLDSEDLAISRKNDRTWAESLDSVERFRLTPMDFGLDTSAERALATWGVAPDERTRNSVTNPYLTALS